MDQDWRQLHLRVARGEALTGVEQAVYDEGLRQHEAAEQLVSQMRELLAAREDVSRLEAEMAALLARRAQLEAEIAALEGAIELQQQFHG